MAFRKTYKLQAFAPIGLTNMDDVQPSATLVGDKAFDLIRLQVISGQGVYVNVFSQPDVPEDTLFDEGAVLVTAQDGITKLVAGDVFPSAGETYWFIKPVGSTPTVVSVAG